MVSVCFSVESSAVYEIQLSAFNGNGDSIANKRLVSLAETEKSRKEAAGDASYSSSANHVHKQ